MSISADGTLGHEEEPDIIKNSNDDSADKIIVDKNDDTHYKSIQKAIDHAQSGSTIYVKEGEYSEIVNINKKIHLIGEGRDKTLINPESQKNKYAVGIRAAGVKLSGFGITNKGPGLYTTGIRICSSQTEIEDCNIFDTPVGIAIWSSENTISNCEFWGCKDEGIVFLGSSSNECNNNVVTNCTFYDNCDGIELQYSSNNTISHCEFYDNTHAGIDAIGSSNNNNIISNCDIYDNEVFGIYISRSSGNQITNCSIYQNQIMISNSENTSIDECELEGIYLRDSAIIIKNCKSLDVSKIKTTNSNYTIYNEESVENKLDTNTKEDTIINEDFFIFDILNLIKIRLETIKARIFDNG